MNATSLYRRTPTTENDLTHLNFIPHFASSSSTTIPETAPQPSYESDTNIAQIRSGVSVHEAAGARILKSPNDSLNADSLENLATGLSRLISVVRKAQSRTGRSHINAENSGDPSTHRGIPYRSNSFDTTSLDNLFKETNDPPPYVQSHSPQPYNQHRNLCDTI